MQVSFRWQCLTLRLQWPILLNSAWNLEREEWSPDASQADCTKAMTLSVATELGSSPHVATRSMQVTFLVNHSLLIEGPSKALPSPDLLPRNFSRAWQCAKNWLKEGHWCGCHLVGTCLSKLCVCVCVYNILSLFTLPHEADLSWWGY